MICYPYSTGFGCRSKHKKVEDDSPMAQDAAEAHVVDPLDRTINLGMIRWSTVAIALALIVGAMLRLTQLDRHALSAVEATHAFDAFRFFQGAALQPGESLPKTEPVALLAHSLSFFLFGVTDATARVAGVLFGIGSMLLVLGLRPFVGRSAVAGIVTIMAISPTLLYLSRTSISTSAGVFALTLIVVSLLHAGRRRGDQESSLWWPVLAGLGFALAFGSGAHALTAIAALAIGLLVAWIGGEHAATAGLRSIVSNRDRLAAMLGAFVATLLVLFSRFFTSTDALEGIWLTVRDWGRLLGTTVSATPGQFFVLAIGLYEVFALVFALVAFLGNRNRDQRLVGSAFFGGWFLASLVLFSISSGRDPIHTAYVVLPLVLLGGCGLGDTIARVDPFGSMGARGWAFVALGISTVVSFFALLILAGRIGDAADARQGWTDFIFVLIVIFLPFLGGTIALARSDRAIVGASRIGGWCLLIAALLLTLTTFRAATELAFANADTSEELLAQRTSTAVVPPLIERLHRLSLDNTRLDGTIADPTGGHGLSVAIDRQVEQPFAWYFRDFPNVTITGEGQAAATGADIVIAANDTGFVTAGYGAQPYAVINRVPGAYTAPNIASILGGIFNPSNWRDSVDYLLYRDLAVPAAPQGVVIGLAGSLADQVLPDTGPYGLLERVGPGAARGQFNGPRGIASGPGGVTYVVDSANGRVQVFDQEGQFVAAWDQNSGSATFALTEQGFGATGITLGADGLVYVADTWAHRVVVLDSTGTVIRTFGQFADNQDSTDAAGNPGLFFGPRSIAVTAEEIFVVDTGNERVQVFGRDGSFKRAFGGNGTGSGQLIEPVGIAIGPDGLVYVADSGNGRISIFTQEGTAVEQWSVDAWAGNLFFEPYLAFGPDGLLYATSSATGSIEVIGEGGALLGSLSTAGTQTLGRPAGIAVLADGSILVTDIGNSGVYRVDPFVAVSLPDAQAPAGPAASPGASPAT
jgi:DNA-binding beta-propeller fold protein YncE/4-amino-4-deoxy-L-arabinose transferase-like glycosyltransferase